jgi:hypothetical protein
VAKAVRAGPRVARAARPGLARTSVVLVLGDDFHGLARVAAAKPSGPPKPTRATRSLPAWDSRPC